MESGSYFTAGFLSRASKWSSPEVTLRCQMQSIKIKPPCHQKTCDGQPSRSWLAAETGPFLKRSMHCTLSTRFPELQKWKGWCILVILDGKSSRLSNGFQNWVNKPIWSVVEISLWVSDRIWDGAYDPFIDFSQGNGRNVILTKALKRLLTFMLSKNRFKLRCSLSLFTGSSGQMKVIVQRAGLLSFQMCLVFWIPYTRADSWNAWRGRNYGSKIWSWSEGEESIWLCRTGEDDTYNMDVITLLARTYLS